MDNKKEQEALDAIFSYMRDGLNQRIAYVKGKERGVGIIPISPQIQAFWDMCIQIFKQDLSQFDVKLKDDPETKNEAEDGSEAEAETEDSLGTATETGTEGSSKNEIIGHVRWLDPMEEFEDVYYNLKAAYCISNDQSLKLDEQFNRLCKKLERKRNDIRKPFHYSVLGEIDFTYLPYMLNLQDEKICALLPYLLTAYTFNFWASRFFSRGKLIPLISCTESEVQEVMLQNFGSTGFDIDSADVAKKRYALKDLARVFSLENCEKTLIIPPKTNNEDRPVPFPMLFETYEPKSSYVIYNIVLDCVFELWSDTILECASLAEIGGFPSNIDFKSCEKLYFDYTDSW